MKNQLRWEEWEELMVHRDLVVPFHLCGHIIGDLSVPMAIIIKDIYSPSFIHT